MISAKSKIGVFVLLTGILYFPLNSCIDKYWPDLGSKYEQLLVVDGMISNQPGPYTIQLALSSNVNRPEFKPVSGYEVIIADDLNNEETLSEIEKGVYQTSPDGMQGAVGRSYKLIINSPDDDRYESEYELLRKPTEIEDVYPEIEFHTVSGYDHNLSGFQFYIDTKKAENDTNYILWRMEDTYQYNANYRAKYVYDDFLMEIFSPSDSLYTCWKTRKRKEIITAKTEDLIEPVLLKLPLNYVTTETRELSIRYSLLVKQYTLDYKAYDFWSSLLEIEDNVDWLYAKQPYQIKGNVTNISNNDEPVLGYFMAAGIDQQRIFVDRPTGVDWHYLDSCNLYPIDRELLLINMNSWPLYFPAVYNGPAQGPVWVDYQWCVDCRESGGELIPPAFWIE